jgi:membrane-bound metal-dependent hydrolase YbcI (DUF457 family)
MPDLVTHLASALLPGVALRRDRAALFALGSALPDLVGRVPGIALTAMASFGVPQGLDRPLGVVHQPLGAVIAAALLAYALPERDRPIAALAISAGAILHVTLDAMQDYGGFGQALLYPLSAARFEWPLFGPEATVPLAPVLASAAAVAWGIRIARERARERRGLA